MGRLVLLSAVVLVVRAALIIAGALVEFNFSITYFVLYETGFYALLEQLPIALMMVVLSRRNPGPGDDARTPVSPAASIATGVPAASVPVSEPRPWTVPRGYSRLGPV
jgi:hypothetical protein